MPAVFPLHSCELWRDSRCSRLRGKLSSVAALGSISVGMKIEQRAHCANFVGGSATPLEGAQCQVHALEGRKQSAKKLLLMGIGKGKATSFVLCRGLWR